MKKKPINSQQLLQTLKASLSNNVEEVPDGFYRIGDWCKQWGMADSQTRRLIQHGISLGIMEAKAFRVPVSKSFTRKVMHYKSKD